jgi:transposase
MSNQPKKHYTLEFKKSSAELAITSDQSISQTAKDLGIKETTLYTWVSKYYPNERLKLPEKSADHLELLRLRKEITRLKQERDILKKAAAYFASDTQ